MKLRFCFYILSALMLMAGCSRYDDTDVVNRLDEVESKLEALEELCKQANTNMTSLQALIVAVQRNDAITGITAITKDGEVVGYTVTFAHSDPITIYNSDVAAGQVPQVSVKEDEDGQYYWTIGGEWLLDADGNKVKVDEGVSSPRFKVEDGYWFVSYDNGESWEQLGAATSGSEGGDSLFADVDTSQDGYVVFTLMDGSKLTIPTSLDDSYIDFLDNSVELLCVINWDTNGDDRLSYEEAAAVESIGNVFTETNIISFNEFKYFTSVKKLEQGTFYECHQLRRLSLPSSLEEIAPFALCKMNNLTEITIPASVKLVEEQSITNIPSLRRIVVEDGNEVYDSRNECNALIHTEGDKLVAASINTVIPEDVRIIGMMSFMYLRINDVVVPDSVEEIAEKAFQGCSVVETMSIGSGVKTWGTNVFNGCTGRFVVNSDLPDCSSEGQSPFCGCRMSALTLGPDVSKVGSYALSNNDGLSELSLNASLTTIGNNAFDDCSALSSVIIPDGVSEIGSCAFRACGALTDVSFGTGLKIIGDEAFKDCKKIKEIKLQDGLESVGERSFMDCSAVTSVVVPASVTSFGKAAFYQCSGEAQINCTIPDYTCYNDWAAGDISSSADGASPFAATKFNKVTIGDSCQGVGDCAFASCKDLVDVVMGSDVKYIGDWAFSQNRALKNISMPENLEVVGKKSFYACHALEEVIVTAKDTLWIDAFKYCINLKKLEVERARVICNSGDESVSVEQLILGEGIEEVGGNAFWCDYMSEVTIPSTVKLLGNRAFIRNYGDESTFSVYLKGSTPPQLDGNPFTYNNIVPAGLSFYVPSSAYDAYVNSWKMFAPRIVAGDF